MFGLLAIVLVAPKPRVVLKPTLQKLSPMFREGGGKAQAVWADGRDTRLRVPSQFEVEERSNRRGDLAGMLYERFSGASSGIWYYPFFKPRRGKFRLLSAPKGADNPFLCDFDDQGRILTVDAPPVGQVWSGLAKPFCRGYLWSKGAWTVLGAADNAHFLKNGDVFGFFWADEKGQPVQKEDFSGTPRKVYFRWHKSKRKLYHAP